jgi:hypothetical protein
MTEFKLITVTDSARRAMITVMILSVLTDLSPGPARPSGPGSQPVNYVNRKCCAKPDVDKYSRSGLTALSQVRRAVSWVWAKGVPLILWASSRRGRCTAPKPANNSRSVSEL